MGHMLPIHVGNSIIQNVQYWQTTPHFNISYFRIISSNHCLKMIYVNIVHQVVLNQYNQHLPCPDILITPSVLKIILQRETYDMTTGEAIKMNIRLLFIWNYTRYQQLMIRYNTP